MDEITIRLHLEPLDEGGYVATSHDVPGLVVEGQSLGETVAIAQGLVQKIVESCRTHGDPLPSALSNHAGGRAIDLVVPVSIG